MIAVSKLCVSAFLKNGKQIPFLIPEYQRPYAWEEEQIDALFNDIWDFSGSQSANDKNGDYFLGCIVSYENEKGQQEIIDGQQRLTSLFLLLRAIYDCLQADHSPLSSSFKERIENALWECNMDYDTGLRTIHFERTHLESKVIDDKANQCFQNILTTGQVDAKAEDNYSKNYLTCKRLFDEKSKSGGERFRFIEALLEKVIVLPITADSQDAALSIFSTLNDRGLPLSEADIFKAKIYEHCQTDEEKADFIENWKILYAEAKRAGEEVQKLFYYYMFYLRAVERDKANTAPGLRKYYSEKLPDGKDNNRLYRKDLMTDLNTILDLWKVVNLQEKKGEPWEDKTPIKKTFDILNDFPNEYWKYPVIIYYLQYHTHTDFAEKFQAFLLQLTRYLMLLYLDRPAGNTIRNAVTKLDVFILETDTPNFETDPSITAEFVKGHIIQPKYNRNLMRMLLKIYAYDSQDALLNPKWQIEHILPRKWQNMYTPKNGETADTINERIEHIGNKTPLEGGLNSRASNLSFARKQQDYSKSEIKITKSLATMISDQGYQFTLDNIALRDNTIANTIWGIFEKWQEGKY